MGLIEVHERLPILVDSAKLRERGPISWLGRERSRFPFDDDRKEVGLRQKNGSNGSGLAGFEEKDSHQSDLDHV